jgi:asparagine synthase (glutamine-hydrolysing)
MCGILGIYGKVPSSEVRHQLSQKLKHRGPDDAGEWTSKSDWLAHVRLSILDIAGGHQPFVSEDGRYVLVFNGEIYNYIELKQQLLAKGHHFSTDGDTEVLFHLLIEQGPNALPLLNGMFAFAFLDTVSRSFLCARDRMGIKPFFYSLVGDKLYFASEMSTLTELVHKDKALSIDREALWHYFSTLYIPSPLTIYREIKSLRPGHYLLCNADDMREVRYWMPPFDQDNSRENDFLDEVQEAIDKSVHIHMRSDVPFGAYLSGGVDSSMVVLAMAREKVFNLRTFNVKVCDDDFDEEVFAAQVSKHCKTHHSVINVSSIDASLLTDTTNRCGQPFADSSLLPTYLVSKNIREYVKVALGGDGADEMFAGYNKYAQADLYVYAPDSVERAFLRVPKEIKSLIFADSFQNGREDTYQFLISDIYSSPKSSFDCLRQLDMRFFLESDILQKVDLMSMAHGLEVRTPFIENRLIDIACAMPASLLRFNGQGKYPLKKLLARELGDQFAFRPKIGFMLPVNKWLFDVIKDMVTVFQEDPNITELNIFSNDGIGILVRQYINGDADIAVGHALYAYVVFCVWFREQRRSGYVSHC